MQHSIRNVQQWGRSASAGLAAVAWMIFGGLLLPAPVQAQGEATTAATIDTTAEAGEADAAQ